MNLTTTDNSLISMLPTSTPSHPPTRLILHLNPLIPQPQEATFQITKKTTMTTTTRTVTLDRLLDALPPEALPPDNQPMDAIPLDALAKDSQPHLGILPLDILLDAHPLDAITINQMTTSK